MNKDKIKWAAREKRGEAEQDGLSQQRHASMRHARVFLEKPLDSSLLALLDRTSDDDDGI